MSITPDGTRLVAVGMDHSSPDVTPQADASRSGLLSLGSKKGSNRMVVFDIASKLPVL